MQYYFGMKVLSYRCRSSEDSFLRVIHREDISAVGEETPFACSPTPKVTWMSADISHDGTKQT